jgi:hypothetical protein
VYCYEIYRLFFFAVSFYFGIFVKIWKQSCTPTLKKSRIHQLYLEGFNSDRELLSDSNLLTYHSQDEALACSGLEISYFLSSNIIFALCLVGHSLKGPGFWDITPCSLLKVNRRFEVSCGICLQGRRISQARHQRDALLYTSSWHSA